MSFPSDRKYTEDHEWAKSEAGKISIGITDHAQSSLGDIVFVELPEVGRTLKKGESFGVVESVKAVSDLYAPLDGQVVEIHESLADDPSVLNKDPHGDGWILRLEASEEQLASLMDSGDYQKHVQNN